MTIYLLIPCNGSKYKRRAHAFLYGTCSFEVFQAIINQIMNGQLKNDINYNRKHIIITNKICETKPNHRINNCLSIRTYARINMMYPAKYK